MFAINALTYLFAVIGLALGASTRAAPTRGSRSAASRRLLSGVRIARRDPLLSHLLLTLFTFSFFSLAFVGLMPVIADENLGIGPKSWQYGVLYACFGLGAALGAVSVGTVFARVLEGEAAAPGVPRVRGRARGVRAAARRRARRIRSRSCSATRTSS